MKFSCIIILYNEGRSVGLKSMVVCSSNTALLFDLQHDMPLFWNILMTPDVILSHGVHHNMVICTLHSHVFYTEEIGYNLCVSVLYVSRYFVTGTVLSRKCDWLFLTLRNPFTKPTEITLSHCNGFKHSLKCSKTK